MVENPVRMVLTGCAMTKKEKDFLFELLETPSPTGFEVRGQRVWAEHIGAVADTGETDAYGSAWATLKGRGKRVVMLEAHADEIGYMVRQVTKEGFLRLERVGGHALEPRRRVVGSARRVLPCST